MKEKFRKYGGKNAYWIISAMLFILLYMALFLYENSGKQTYEIIFFGDSIIGNVRDETSVTAMLEQNLNVSVYNGAFGGTTMAKREVWDEAADMTNSISMAELAKALAVKDFSVQNAGITVCTLMDYFPETAYGFSEINPEEIQLIFIEQGVNDYMTGIPLDNDENPMDVYSFGGALRTTLELLQASYPDVRIILCTPAFCWPEGNDVDCREINYGYGILEEYVNLELEIAESYNVEVIDNYHIFIDGSFGMDLREWHDCTEDGIHPNRKGREVIARAIAEYVRTHIE